MSSKKLILLVVAFLSSACGSIAKQPDQTDVAAAVGATSAAEQTATAEFHRAVENLLTASAPPPTLTSPPTKTPTPTETPAPPPLPPEGVLSFSSNRDGDWDIFVIQADGFNTYNITNSAANDGEPAWSPDGSEVLFTTDRDGDLNIYRMMMDGAGLVNLTPHEDGELPCDENSPMWSEDGAYIKIEKICDDAQIEQVMKRDGTGQTVNQIDSELFSPITIPGLSPDGTMRLQESFQDDNMEIMIGPSDGSAWENLTNSPSNDSDPVWSPDGRYIAFVSDRDDNLEIYLTTPDGSLLLNLTNNPHDDNQPDWNPNLTLVAQPPAPTPTPTSTSTPEPTNTPTLTSTVENTPSAIIRGPGEKSPGDHPVRITNDTDGTVTIYMYGEFNYIFYVPAGIQTIFVRPGFYSFTYYSCGESGTGSGVFNSNWRWKFWCND